MDFFFFFILFYLDFFLSIENTLELDMVMVEYLWIYLKTVRLYIFKKVYLFERQS